MLVKIDGITFQTDYIVAICPTDDTTTVYLSREENARILKLTPDAGEKLELFLAANGAVNLDEMPIPDATLKRIAELASTISAGAALKRLGELERHLETSAAHEAAAAHPVPVSAPPAPEIPPLANDDEPSPMQFINRRSPMPHPFSDL